MTVTSYSVAEIDSQHEYLRLEWIHMKIEAVTLAQDWMCEWHETQV
jgi:hypothetical protein